MKTCLLTYGLLFIISIVTASRPATGPSGTVCESAGGSCKGIHDGTMIPYKGDCGKYIVCFLDCGCDRPCPDGLHFNPVKQTCDYPSKAGCNPSWVDPPTGSPGNECQSPESSCKNITDGTLISFGNDCTQYIQCLNGCTHHRSCPPGTHFSSKSKRCLMPSDAGCDPSPGNLNPDPSCPGCSQPSGPQCQSVGGSCKNISDGTLISYANDCTKYIQCSKGCGTNMDCPAGVHFSPKFKVCTAPSKAGCDPAAGNLNPDPSCPGCSQPLGPQCQSVGGSCENISDGTLISYANDCTKYIQCSKGCGTNMDCPSGLHFSPKFKVCTAMSKAGCDLAAGNLNPDPSCPGCSQPSGPQCQSVGGSCENISDGTLISYANDCTKYIQCSKGCGTNMDCPAGLHFSPKFEVCTAPSKAGCDPAAENLNPDPSCPGCSQPSGPQCQSVGGSCENISDGTLISYANDCTKYIQCSKGCGTNMDCPARLHFSPKFKVCTAPSKAGCDPAAGNLNPDPSCPGCSQPSGPQCQSVGGSCENISDGTLISYANDCTKYIQCSKGCGTNMDCPAGLHFSPKFKVCTAPSKAGCDSAAGNFNPDPSCPGCSQPSGPQCQSVGGSCENISDGTLISYANDCTKYIQCSKGCGTNMDCPAGLHFSPKFKVCTAPSKARCDLSPGNLNPDPSCPGCSQPSGPQCQSVGGSCENISDGTLISYANDCTKYIQCSKGCGTNMDCPAGLHFSPKFKVCTAPSKAGCDLSPGNLNPDPSCPGCSQPSGPQCQSVGGSCENISDGTLISYANDCTKYIQCSKKCGTNMDCPAGLHFSPKFKVCTAPSKAGCDPAAGNLNPDPSCPGCSQPSGPQCQSVGGSCENISDGTLISYANDCTKYIKCSKGCGTNMYCPAGLHFSPKFKVCTAPSKAGCDLSPGNFNPDPSCPGCSQPSGPQCQSVGGSCENISDGTLISYANDCTKYIQCSKGCGTNMDCPAGLHFSPKFKVCTAPSKAGCDLSPGNLNPDPSCPGCSQPSGPQCQSVGGSCENVSDGTLISYANDCTKYIQCSKKCGTNMDCPAGLHFSPKFKVCTAPSKAGCDLSPGNLNPDPSCPGCSQPSGPQCQSVGGSCENVSDGTLISYANDCTKYIQCSKGCGTNKDCPAGQHFCPKLQVCTAPSKAGCDPAAGNLNPDPSCPGCSQPSGPQCQSVGGSCENISDGTLISYANDCTKYIQCSKKCGTNKNCPTGLHFCPKLQVCTTPSKAGCDPAAGNLNPDPSCPGCSQPSGPQCQSVGGSCENVSDGILISYANDCTKYIQCSKGCGTNKDCPAELHFCPKHQVCTTPSKAGCDPAAGNLNPDPSCPGCSQPSGPQCQSVGGSCENVSDGILISYANDCTKYIQCSKGCGTNKDCPAGLHFCLKLQECTVPAKAGCDPSAGNSNPNPPCPCATPGSEPKPNYKPEPISPNPSPSISSPSTSQPSKPSIKPSPGSVQNPCSGQEAGKLLPFPKNCTKFIACSSDGLSYIMECGSGSHFNAALELCDWPEDAGCDPSYVKPEINPNCQSKGTSCLGKEDGKLLPYPDDCQRFYACADGCEFEMACGENLHFNQYLEVCDWPKDAGCDPALNSKTSPCQTC